MDDYNPRTRYEHYYVRMARLEGRGELQKRYPDDFYVRPFQIAGNVYYIGNKAVCSHLIDTGEGLIVIDTSYPELDHLLINSIWEAGFDPKDIRIVLHTHLHYDHFGATNTLTKIYGAKAYVGRDEWESVQRKPELAVIPQDPYLSYRMIRPDVLLEDGDEIRLGNTVIHCIETAGHTEGTCQYSYKDYEVIAVFGRGAGEMLFANKQSGITSMEDLLEKSKANPGTIKMGMSSGGNTHVYALLLQQAGFDCNIVDGGDGSDRIAALVGGHVDVCFVPYLTAKEYIENGDVTPLCTIGDRCSALPDTPSINESGYVKNNFNGCYIWMAPKGTDAGIVSYLASLCEDVVNNNAKYDEDQRAINFNDPFIVTGQDALDFLEELQQTAIENVGVLG